MADAKFVTELVGMDFSKESTSRDKLVLFRKVIDHMEMCKETIDDPDTERFAQIVKNFKVSNFEHIFSRTGFPSKVDHPEFIEVKRVFQCTLAIRRSKWNLPFEAPWHMEEDQEEFLLSSYWLKMEAQQGVNSAKDILKELRSNEEEKTGGTTMVTASDTSIVEEENPAGNATVAMVPGTIKPALGAPAIAEIRTFFSKKTGPN